MSAPQQEVKVVETCDRYLVLDAATGEDMEEDGIGWATADGAVRFARRQGWQVVKRPDMPPGYYDDE